MLKSQLMLCELKLSLPVLVRVAPTWILQFVSSRSCSSLEFGKPSLPCWNNSNSKKERLNKK